MTAPTSPTLPLAAALQQAITHHQAGQLQQAERLYRAILQAQPNHPDANHNLGVLAVQVKQPAAGLPHFKGALEANPNQSQYWLSYIDALIQSGQQDTARHVLEQGRQQGLQGEAFEALAGRLACPVSAEIEKMVLLFNQGRNTELEPLALAMTERFPQHGFGWKILGAVFQQQGRLEEALQAKKQATRLLPEDAEAHNNLGHALQELGRLSDAEDSLRTALALNPDYPSAYNNLGRTLQQMGRLNEAETSLCRALALKPDYAEAHNNLGVTLENKGQFSAAEASYRQALLIKPSYAEAYKNLGNVFLTRKMMQQAVACYEHAIAIAPNYEAAHNNLGAVHFILGNIDLAVSCYQQAHELKPSSSGALHNLGSALYYQGNMAAAIACFRKALTFRPDHWVVDSAAYLAVLYYLADDLPSALQVIEEFKDEVAEATQGNAKLGAYFRYLHLLISSQETAHATTGQLSDGMLYVIGDSHALSLHNVQVLHRGQVKTCRSNWILGCKQWHLGNDQANSYKHKFEAEIARLPRLSTILLTIGEIDCRPNEGILMAWEKYPGKSLDDVAQATLTGYVRYVAGIATQYGHQMIIGGVPATNVPLHTLTADAAKQLVRLIRVFNTMLKEQALAAGMDFLDVYALTDRGDGTASGQWHIDDFHLTPSAMAEAFQAKEKKYQGSIPLPVIDSD